MWIPPRSPFNLIQEQLWEDPWKIFVACIFCNLTKRVQSEPTIWKFFEKYPSPELVSEKDRFEILSLVSHLGLSRRRTDALIRMSYDYITKDWKDDPTVLYGVGKYGSDAYRIFCTENWESVSPSDHALSDYYNFLIKNKNAA